MYVCERDRLAFAGTTMSKTQQQQQPAETQRRKSARASSANASRASTFGASAFIAVPRRRRTGKPSLSSTGAITKTQKNTWRTDLGKPVTLNHLLC